jgi:PAS domain-containing protein
MTQHDVELILTQHLASTLAVPVFIVAPNGDLIYYNEPAESILGQRFDETGEMSANIWATAFTPLDDKGQAIPPDKLPLMIALSQRKPAHSQFQISGLDGVQRWIEVTAFPIEGQGNRFLGAVAMFWESQD